MTPLLRFVFSFGSFLIIFIGYNLRLSDRCDNFFELFCRRFGYLRTFYREMRIAGRM